MLDGWRDRQLARNLAPATITSLLAVIRAFTGHADAFPWAWRPQMLDEWLGDLRAVRGLRRSTIRGYSETAPASRLGNDRPALNSPRTRAWVTSRAMSAPQTPRSESEKLIKLKIIQDQAGHEYASTTAIYTNSRELRTRTLSRAMEAAAQAALAPERSR